MTVSPPRPKGPALNALRAFEAAARLESFAAAAEELSVTSGAISQHIKALEEWSGVKLFKRLAHGVELSPEGRKVLPDFVKAFNNVGAAVRAISDLRPMEEVHIATMPCLAQLWLPKRLKAVRQAFPEISISVTALEDPPNLKRTLFDMSLFIRPSKGGDEEMIIAQDRIYPLCTPELAKTLSGPDDLGSISKLVDKSWEQDWADWAKQDGNDLPLDEHSPRFSLFSVALEEAKAGAGVLMAHECLTEDAEGQEALVRPFGEAVETGKSLVLEVPPRKAVDPKLVDIITFLVSE